MRLIDADAFIKSPAFVCGGAATDPYWNGYADALDRVDEVLEYYPTVDAIPVTADELKHLINDTIAYIWRLEERRCDKPEFGYDSRKALLEKLQKFYNEHFPENDCHC